MAAHGRINADGLLDFALRHLIIKCFAHAEQALEFKITICHRHHMHGGNCLRIMRGELRIETITAAQHVARTSQVTYIGGDFAREHREAFKPTFLRAFDFRIPISAFDQADG